MLVSRLDIAVGNADPGTVQYEGSVAASQAGRVRRAETLGAEGWTRTTDARTFNPPLYR